MREIRAALGDEAARPQFIETVHRRGVDIIAALDTSYSMNTEDVAPNRLEKAKGEIRRLIQKSEGDRIGLVSFSGAALVQCPLTLDYSVIQKLGQDTKYSSQKNEYETPIAPKELQAVRGESEESFREERQRSALSASSEKAAINWNRSLRVLPRCSG